MRYRQLDANGDYVFGAGLANFWIDVPEAPAQAALTRLRLKAGEWFNDITDGTPWDSQVLGNRTTGIRDVALKMRILGTPGIQDIASYSSNVTPLRQYTMSCTLDTVYGTITLSGPVT